MMVHKVIAFCLGIVLFAHCLQAQFNDITTEMGLDKSTVSLSLMGGGAAFIDYNNDGLLDIYLVGGDKPDYLFRNNGYGSYEDVSYDTYIAQVTNGYNTSAVAVGDINNDGCIDLFVTTYSRSKSGLLFINNCSGGFYNISESAGINVASSSTGVAFIDVNLDGYLDIYVVNYIDARRFTYDTEGKINGFNHDCFPNQLYINNGDETFTEMAEAYGVADIGCGLAVLPTDYDQDGDQDLIVVNDFGQWVQPNRLYKNNYPAKSFEDVSVETGMDIGIYGMGVAPGDFDNDGDIDYYFTNIGENVMLRNNGDNTFTDVAIELGIDNGKNTDGTNTTGWGCFFFDYDNDTELDLFVSNGYIPASPFLNTSRTDANSLFQNVGMVFTNVAPEYGLDNKGINRGALYGDYDNNGTQDLFAVSTTMDGNGSSAFYENTFNTNNWIDIKLVGTVTNRDAFGAWVYTYLGDKPFVKELSSGGSHASQHSTILHFGLGATTEIDSIAVIWPRSGRQVFKNIPSNQRIQITENVGGYEILGCMDSDYDNYNPNATVNSGCITLKVVGCTDPRSSNYNPLAEIDNGSCETITGLSDFELTKPRIYPSPFTSILHIQLPNSSSKYEFEMIEIQGKRIEISFLDKGDFIEANTEDIPNGMYLLRIIDVSKNKIHTHKIVKY